MTRKIHRCTLKHPPTHQEKFSKHEGLFQKPLDIFHGNEKKTSDMEFSLHQCNIVTL